MAPTIGGGSMAKNGSIPKKGSLARRSVPKRAASSAGVADSPDLENKRDVVSNGAGESRKSSEGMAEATEFPPYGESGAATPSLSFSPLKASTDDHVRTLEKLYPNFDAKILQ